MAFSNPQVYLDELARPLCKRFEAEPTSYELAISSCIILYHFADVVAHVRGQKPYDVADEIAAIISGFHTIRAIANAGKHVELTRHPNSDFIGLRAEHLFRGQGFSRDNGAHFADGSTRAGMPETIVVETPDGTKHDVLFVCLSVLSGLDAHPQFCQV